VNMPTPLRATPLTPPPCQVGGFTQEIEPRTYSRTGKIEDIASNGTSGSAVEVAAGFCFNAWSHISQDVDKPMLVPPGLRASGHGPYRSLKVEVEKRCNEKQEVEENGFYWDQLLSSLEKVMQTQLSDLDKRLADIFDLMSTHFNSKHEVSTATKGDGSHYNSLGSRCGIDVLQLPITKCPLSPKVSHCSGESDCTLITEIAGIPRTISRKWNGSEHYSENPSPYQSQSKSEKTPRKSQMSETGWREYELSCKFKSDDVKSKRQMIWELLEDVDSSRGAMWAARLETFLIFLSVAAGILLSSETSFFGVEADHLVNLLLVLDFIFTMEALLRFGVTRSVNMRYFKNPYNVIDFTAGSLTWGISLPCLFGQFECTGDTSLALARMTFLPVLRLLKVLRHFKHFHLFFRLATDIMEAMAVLLLLLCIMVLSFASLVYWIEPRDNIPSLPIAMYFVVTTISTVGYGDYSPQSDLGIALVSCLIIASILFMALPLGVIGNAFAHIWSERDAILIITITKDRFAQWGITLEDMTALFRHFDGDKDGELNLEDFVNMMEELRIGINPDKYITLFEAFDKDGGGTIDVKEFARVLFPTTQEVLRASVAAHNSESGSRQGSKEPQAHAFESNT